MNEDIKSKFNEYEELKVKQKSIDNRLDELKVDLIEAIPDNTFVEANFGKFSKKARTQWKYSISTTQMAEDLKNIQKEEQQTGDAEAILGAPYIQYTIKK